MKRIFFLPIIAALLVACNSEPEYKIAGTVSNNDLNDQYVYLYEYGNDTAPLDSAIVQKGLFTFKGQQNTPALRVLRFAGNVVEPARAPMGENAPYTAVFVLENSSFKAVLSESPSVTGNPANDDYADMQAQIKKIRADRQKLIDEMKSDDATVLAEAEKKYDEMEDKVSQTAKAYILAHNNSPLAAKTLMDFRYSLTENERREIVNNAGNEFKSVPGMDKLIDHLRVLEGVAVGQKFTDFEMNDPKGNAHKLSEYVGNGKVVLIDFWASWCPPCRRDMPHLVELYKQYKNKDFEIVGVSLDRTGDAWEKGIKDLNITWPQLSDLKYWQSQGAALYGVNSIPHTVLIDKDGTIIAKNLRGKELDDKLAEIL